MCKSIQLVLILSFVFAFHFAAKAITIDVEVDATEISRKLVHSKISFPVTPGPNAIRYAEWIPGIHAPRGPIENLGGLRISDEQGNTIKWQRDPKDRYRFTIVVPDTSKSICVELDYICNQPSTNSTGVDTYGNSFIGVINWNTIIVYPEGYKNSEIEVNASLSLPTKWKLGCALSSTPTKPNTWKFEKIGINEFIDSPVIFGENFKRIELQTKDFAPFRMHITSESAAALLIPDETIEKFNKLALEAKELFGGGHFEAYDFLVFCSDELPMTGLEHRQSSLNGISERAFLEEKKLLGWEGSLLPHEFVHSWCGKFRRPEGMLTDDFHTVKDTRLLWVYEGLTQHLGEVLTVRCGIWDLEHFKQVFARKLSGYRGISGRAWRSLEDTAADSYHLRGRSKHWSGLRRGQDYYNEGQMFWLEVDSILREGSNDEITLDHFAKNFLGANYPGGDALAFTEGDVIAILDKLYAYDWQSVIQRRITDPQESLPLEFIERLGYKLRYSSERSEAQKESENEYKYANAIDSLGMSIGDNGSIGSNIVSDSPADKAGLAPRMKIIGVNDRKFSLDRFREGIADTVIRGSIRFLIEDGDRFQTIEVNYDGGLRYLELTRDESKPDRLASIFKAQLDTD